MHPIDPLKWQDKTRQGTDDDPTDLQATGCGIDLRGRPPSPPPPLLHCCCCQVMCTKCLVSRLDQVFSVIGNWPWTTHISDVFNSNNYNGYVARNCNFVSQLMDFLLMPPLIRNTLPADQQQQQQPRDLTSLWLYLIILIHGNLSGLFAWLRNLSGVQMLSPKKNEHGRWTSSHSVSQFLYYYYSSTGQPPPNTTTTMQTLRTVNLPTY